MELGVLHLTYLAIITLIIATIIRKEDIVLPCIIGIGLLGYLATGSLLRASQVLYRAVYVSGREFIDMIIVIALVKSMSTALKDCGADELIVGPLKSLMINKSMAFFVLGFTTLVTAWLIWPSPAIGFIGAIMVPAAIKAGLPNIWAAAALNIFGNGSALSGDYFIQGAPSITARSAGLGDPSHIITASIPLWLIMSTAAGITSYLMMKRDSMSIGNTAADMPDKQKIITASRTGMAGAARFISIAVPALFIIDIGALYIYGLKGGEATSLIGGTAVIIFTGVSLINNGWKRSFGEVTALVKEGAVYSIKVFAPIVVIGAFFLMGNKNTASEIFGGQGGGYLGDMGMYLASVIPRSKAGIILIHTAISALLGIGGSGFSGLPLVGALAEAFSSDFPINKAGLAALGQIVTIWVGGGTIIPWRVAPVAAVCGVESYEIVRKNLIPFLIGVIATAVAAVFLL